MTGVEFPLAPPGAACRLTIVIPARDESGRLPAAVRAFAAQRDLMGRPYERSHFELIVLCNGCTDDTAAAARRLAAEHPALTLHVLEAPPGSIAHVGDARGTALDLAARRYALLGWSGRAILASTDADTIVAPDWVAQTLREIEAADAVAGYVRVPEAERDRMLAPQRLLYDRELAYRRLLGAIEHRFDPRPWDPEPRHDAFVGASFAVRANAYVAAGTLPRRPHHEDLAFALALERSGARIRHSYNVYAETAARAAARVDGGFGSFLNELARKGTRRESYGVRAAAATIEAARARHLVRRLADGAGGDRMIREIASLIALPERAVRRAVSVTSNAAAAWALLEPQSRQAAYPEEPVEVTIATFRRTLATPGTSLPATAGTAALRS